MQAKPLMHRRTFWKGFAAGTTVMSAVVVLGVWAVSAAAPPELSQGVRPTWEPLPATHHTAQFRPVDLGPCDTRGKDCVVFDDHPVIAFEAPTYNPFEAPTRTVPEPSSLWLVGLASALATRRRLRHGP